MVALLVALGTSSAAIDARAEIRCAPIAGGNAALADIDSGLRLAYIQRRLNADARRVRIWAWSWAAIYSGLVVVNGTRLGLSTSREDKIDNGVATGASMFGLAVLAAMPPAVLRDQPRLARIVARSAYEPDRCALVAAAETILLRDAASEAFSAGPLPHAGNFVFNMALGLVLAVGLGRLETGMIVGLTGITVGEIQLLSVKTRIRQTLTRYRNGQLDDARSRETATAIGWTVVPIMSRENYGVQFGLTF